MTTPARSHQPPPAPFVRARVADAMTEGLITCPPSTPLRSVAQLMTLDIARAVAG